MSLAILKIRQHCITPIWTEQDWLLKALRRMMLQQILVLVGLWSLAVVALDLKILQLTLQRRMDLLWLHVFFATGWTCVVSAQPILDTLLTVWLKAVAALLGLVEQILADGAAKVLWHHAIQVGDAIQKGFVVCWRKSECQLDSFGIVVILQLLLRVAKFLNHEHVFIY